MNCQICYKTILKKNYKAHLQLHTLKMEEKSSFYSFNLKIMMSYIISMKGSHEKIVIFEKMMLDAMGQIPYGYRQIKIEATDNILDIEHLNMSTDVFLKYVMKVDVTNPYQGTIKYSKALKQLQKLVCHLLKNCYCTEAFIESLITNVKTKLALMQYFEKNIHQKVEIFHKIPKSRYAKKRESSYFPEIIIEEMIFKVITVKQNDMETFIKDQIKHLRARNKHAILRRNNLISKEKQCYLDLNDMFYFLDALKLAKELSSRKQKSTFLEEWLKNSQLSRRSSKYYPSIIAQYCGRLPNQERITYIILKKQIRLLGEDIKIIATNIQHKQYFISIKKNRPSDLVYHKVKKDHDIKQNFLTFEDQSETNRKQKSYDEEITEWSSAMNKSIASENKMDFNFTSYLSQKKKLFVDQIIEIQSSQLDQKISPEFESVAKQSQSKMCSLAKIYQEIDCYLFHMIFARGKNRSINIRSIPFLRRYSSSLKKMLVNILEQNSELFNFKEEAFISYNANNLSDKLKIFNLNVQCSKSLLPLIKLKQFKKNKFQKELYQSTVYNYLDQLLIAFMFYQKSKKAVFSMKERVKLSTNFTINQIQLTLGALSKINIITPFIHRNQDYFRLNRYILNQWTIRQISIASQENKTVFYQNFLISNQIQINEKDMIQERNQSKYRKNHKTNTIALKIGLSCDESLKNKSNIFQWKALACPNCDQVLSMVPCTEHKHKCLTKAVCLNKKCYLFMHKNKDCEAYQKFNTVNEYARIGICHKIKMMSSISLKKPQVLSRMNNIKHICNSLARYTEKSRWGQELPSIIYPQSCIYSPKLLDLIRYVSLNEEYLPLTIEKTERKGFGLFTTAKLIKNTLICIYSGQIRSHPYNLGDSIFRLGSLGCVDISICCNQEFNCGRFINCHTGEGKPNLKASSCLLIDQRHQALFYIYFTTICEVQKNTELCYKYGKQYEEELNQQLNSQLK